MRVNKPTNPAPNDDRDQRDAMRQERLGELLRQNVPHTAQQASVQPPGLRKPGR